MKFFLSKIMIMLSSMTIFMNNPMSLGLLLLMQTMMVILFMNKVMLSSWFSMVTFMMMIGGLLIMFMYMSGIASNEKFKLNINISMVIIISLIIMEELMFENQINEEQKFINLSTMDLSLTKIYNSKSFLMTIVLVMYLLLTMISVTKMVKHNKGPLRSFN
uniref:NADH dehydrogenase subunit 6 n=1 Tax=Zorka agnesae TaxID=2893156 RepID=A0A9E6XQC7_9HEMI|nr:NADH dehydrogenase subunit 6 [Zorka agnesae]UGN61469.1 NADH dehydrogenase subunit 6 [Zorka agnesae]